MRRLVGALLVSAVVIGSVAAGTAPAHAAEIVTHAWIATDAIDRVSSPDLHALLDAHRDRVREIGRSFLDAQPVDIRGVVVAVRASSHLFGPQGPVFRFGAGTVTTWPK